MNLLRLALPALRRGLVYLLLAATSFGGVRVVCIEDPGRAPNVAAQASADDCTESCSLRAVPGNETRCALTDSAPLLMFVAADALLPSDAPLPVLRREPHVYPDPRSIYDEPALARVIPPPEA